MDREEVKKALLESYASVNEAKRYPIDNRLLEEFLKEVRHLLLLDFDTPNFTEKTMDCLLAYIRENYLRLTYQADNKKKGNPDDFITQLPAIRKSLVTSLSAIYDGDPAAKSYTEIIYSYPGFKAILYYRIGHIFYEEGYPYLARLISEKAHSQTGIDINPGAKIGDYFFIDHGTGIVIGETAIIGNRVKLYQGVTLGAKSLSKGHLLQGKKRHPTVEDDVTIYSNASILGGESVIGHDTTIGSSVYLTESVPPYSLVLLGNSGITITPKRTKK